MKLKEDFFARDTEKVARELMRKYLVREIGGKTIYGEIIRVAAYRGEERRDTKSILYLPGKIYMYPFRGHHILNISTEDKGIPACVLIYQIKKDGEELGPIKLVKELKITKEFDGLSIAGEELYIDDFIVEKTPSDIPTCVKRYWLKKV